MSLYTIDLIILQNNILPYILYLECDLGKVNKLFRKFGSQIENSQHEDSQGVYKKWCSHIQPHGEFEKYYAPLKGIKIYTPMSIARYREGKHHGAQILYGINGNIITLFHYKYGMKDGWCEKWYEETNKIKRVKRMESYYKNNLLEGEYKEWYENGNYKYINEFSNNLAHGIHKEYYENGTLKILSLWENGIIIKKEYYLINGSKSLYRTYKNGFVHGWCKSYFNNEKNSVYQEGGVEEGKQHGLSIEYYNNGNKRHEKKYIQGEINGKVIEYYINGEKKKEYYMYKNLIEGELKIWSETGILIEHTCYKNNKFHGLRQLWDYNTGLLSREYYSEDVLIDFSETRKGESRSDFSEEHF